MKTVTKIVHSIVSVAGALWLVGHSLTVHFSCGVDWKLYRACFVGDYDIASVIHGLQFYGQLDLLFAVFPAFVLRCGGDDWST